MPSELAAGSTTAPLPRGGPRRSPRCTSASPSDPDAAQRLHDEEGRYRRLTAAHFEAMDVPLGTVGVAARIAEVVEALAPYRPAVDLTIVRVLAGGDLSSLVAVAEAAAP